MGIASFFGFLSPNEGRGFHRQLVSADFPVVCTHMTPVFFPAFILPQGGRRLSLVQYGNLQQLRCSSQAFQTCAQYTMTSRILGQQNCPTLKLSGLCLSLTLTR